MTIARSLALVALLTMCVSPALAQPVVPDAEQLFQDGRALMLEGRFEEACPKLEQSQQLEPRAGTMLNLAVCHERLGLIASAWVEFQQARDAASADGRTKLRDLAQQRIDVLGPRVPWVTIAVAKGSRVDGLAVALNGAPVDPDEWGVAMPIDPGDHILVSAAPGFAPREQRFVVAESKRTTVQVAKLERLPAPKPAKPLKKKRKKKKKRKQEVDEPTQERQLWVLELGLFGGYLLVEGGRLSPAASPSAIVVTANGTNEPASCQDVGCDYERGPQGGAAVGVSIFGGYAATDALHVGAKVVLGPRAGGGVMFATGPMVQFHIVGPVWLGAGAMLGTTSATARATVLPAPGYYSGENVDVSSSIDLAGGLAVDLSLHVFENVGGALTLGVSPVVLFGAGSALSVPFTLGWRFQ